MRRKLPIITAALVVALVAVGVGFGLIAGSGSGTESPSYPSANVVANSQPDTAGDQKAVTDTMAETEAGDASPSAAMVVPPANEDRLTLEMVEPDLDFENALTRAQFSTARWKTDFSLHTVPYNEIISGGPPRDGIPPLDDPWFTTFADGDRWLDPEKPVIALEVNVEARAYPIQILTWHEIVNDVIGDVPVSITFCPLCNAAIVFDRRLDGVVYDFGTSGNLRHSDLIMWDRQTESWWQQFTGEAIVGALAGTNLTFIPAPITSWDDFKAANPEGSVLSRDTGFDRPYGRNPYAGYDRADQPPFLYFGDLDERLLPKERVASVTIGDVDAAFPFSVLEKEKVVNYTVNGQDLVVLFDAETRSAFLDMSTGQYEAAGATGMFDPMVEGQLFRFAADGDSFVDEETGSVWNILGEAIEGPLTGKALTPVVHGSHFWFAVAAFNPDTIIYRGLS